MERASVALAPHSKRGPPVEGAGAAVRMSAAVAFTIVGFIVIACVWIPLLTRSPLVPLTLPLFCVILGVLLGWALGIGSIALSYRADARHLTAIALIVGVAGTGLKIDRRFRWAQWGSAWRLLAVAMPLSIFFIAVAGAGLAGLGLGEAILLGASLAPTDPVLASSIEVGPPGRGEEGEVRFALTAEAGLNDGLAFPFVLLGLTLASSSHPGSVWSWLLWDLLWAVLIGAAIGVAFAWALVRIDRMLPERFRMTETGEGMMGLGIGFLAYGLAQLAHSNGFVAVFAAAVAFRNLGGDLEYFQKLDEAIDQFERLAMAVILVLFGAAIEGGLLSELHAIDIVIAVLALLVVRPFAAVVSFMWSKQPMPVRLATGGLGVRGLASLYYAAYAVSQVQLEHAPRLWSIIGFTVLVSIAMYGLSADPVMSYVDRLRRAHEQRHTGA